MKEHKEQGTVSVTKPHASLFFSDTNPNKELLGQRLMEDRPKQGTVVIVLSRDMTNKFAELSDLVSAVDTGSATLEQARKAKRDWRLLWMHLFAVNPDVNPGWPLSLCLYTGTVYVSE